MRFYKYILLVIAIALTGCNDPKYAIGQCITPTDPNASWHNEYAVVKDYGTSLRMDNVYVYTLEFPNYRSETDYFNKQWIESKTLLTRWENCLLK